MLNKKGQVVLFVYFFIAAIIIIVIAAVFAPMGVEFTTAMYAAGDDILEDAKERLDGIDDTAVRASVNGTIEEAQDAQLNNIEVNSALFQYGWVIALVLTSIITFLMARRIVEVGGGGFV